ncbi:hypothetical protein Cfla_3411 [Cellulomonas flavigena DSM 20109]|uniref:Uncharacterized protein n=1 Tax=Cellulomonas flavigena (strain ATCC 482 / DSM 20109 / BCRC 11376 / JCM 18109 / NBRC 3775 / NCIMB 8073 / NRS 134) TaxID=446466 RepID=D5UCQ3_CELFN|nr:hypothetical protein [Cellulomonas flavigena]ADG76288.1 hypothetical protein Cfla_3411 [Cellulomonas flavigena DSM 20109]
MSARYGSEGLGAWVLDRLGPSARTRRRRGEPPEVDVRTGRSVASVTLRAVLALVGVVTVLVAATLPGRPVPVGLLAVMVVVALTPAVAPRWPTTALVVLVVGVRVALAEPPSPLLLALLVLLVHVLLRLGAVAAHTAWRTRVEVAVLLDDGRAALGAQLGAQALALVAGAVAAGTVDDAWRLAGLVAVVVLSVLALLPPVRPWWQRRPGD